MTTLDASMARFRRALRAAALVALGLGAGCDGGGTNHKGPGEAVDSGTGSLGAPDGGSLPVAGALHVSAAQQHTCALERSGEVVCWGDNHSGQLGDRSSATQRLAPTAVVGITDATHLTAGDFHTCAVQRSGVLSRWGRNDQGQVGDGSTRNRNRPTVVVGVP